MTARIPVVLVFDCRRSPEPDGLWQIHLGVEGNVGYMDEEYAHDAKRLRKQGKGAEADQAAFMSEFHSLFRGGFAIQTSLPQADVEGALAAAGTLKTTLQGQLADVPHAPYGAMTWDAQAHVSSTQPLVVLHGRLAYAPTDTPRRMRNGATVFATPNEYDIVRSWLAECLTAQGLPAQGLGSLRKECFPSADTDLAPFETWLRGHADKAAPEASRPRRRPR